MGHGHMFDFSLDYQRDAGIRHFLTGTPPILSTATIEPGVDLLLEAGMENLRAKSIQQTEYLIYLWQQWLEPYGFRLKSPLDAARRGSHISLGHTEGWGIDQALIHEMNVIPDFRQPDNIRLGIAPLYTSFSDIYAAVKRLHIIMEEELYKTYRGKDATVT
jgi:kynureninase